jgi:ankyrin repeat protein
MHSQSEEYTPLMVALYKGYYEISKLLLDYNAAVNFHTVSGHYPLVFCFRRYEEDKYKYENHALCMMMIELMLSKGADLNIRLDNNPGLNILMKLVTVEFEEEDNLQSTLALLKFLIERGANKKMLTLNGNSLEDTIKSVKYHDKIIKIIDQTNQIYFYNSKCSSQNYNNVKTTKLKLKESENQNKSKNGNGKINQIMLDRETLSEDCCLIF